MRAIATEACAETEGAKIPTVASHAGAFGTVAGTVERVPWTVFSAARPRGVTRAWASPSSLLSTDDDFPEPEHT